MVKYTDYVSSKFDVIRETIDIDEISNWYLNQCREDVVKLISVKKSSEDTF